MSAEINNTTNRKKVIKELLKRLHDGEDFESVKQSFALNFSGVSAAEISEAEQALMEEDGVTANEIQALCDVHAAIFEGNISQIHAPDAALGRKHPIKALQEENARLDELVGVLIPDALEKCAKNPDDKNNLAALKELIDELGGVKKHYQKKENVLFPYLEKRGINGPPKVMWGVDDEIRAKIKAAAALIDGTKAFNKGVENAVKEAAGAVSEMIFKEENILFPMMLEALNDSEWHEISKQMPELDGYSANQSEAGAWQAKNPEEKPEKSEKSEKSEKPEKQGISSADGNVKLPTGILNFAELTGLLNTLPIDITFVDKDGTVKYFSENAERIFPRTRAIIGRKVINCHPPASMHVVEKILEDFESGAKDEESFWIKMGGNYVYIRYFAVRNEKGEFLGTLEVTQNIAPIQKITGEKRIMD